jgi:ABC-2 type transport system permease protein
MLPMLFVMPFVQLIILAHAADFEIRNINIHIVSHENNAFNNRLIQKFVASKHFNVIDVSGSQEQAHDNILRGDADLYLELQKDFEKTLIKEQTSGVSLVANAIDGLKAGLATGYASTIIRDFNQNINVEWAQNTMLTGSSGIEVRNSFWFNPELEYANFMVPGILVILVTAIGMFFTGINIVREKEIGTIEQINVTPIRKSQFIIGKLTPFLILGLMELALGLTIGKIVFDIPIEGSLGLIFGFATLYLLAVLGLGMLMSTITNTQQQAMFMSWFFLMIFVLMSGLFTPIESMPGWAQKITWFNPVSYFIDVNRKVLLRGSDFSAIQPQFIKITIFAIVINILAILNYRKTSSS